jgi:5-methylcytosine-specific restriction protein A
MASTPDFRAALTARLANAERLSLSHLDVNAGDLHRQVGGYPGPKHRMPMCCNALRAEMRPPDAVMKEPPKGNGASLTIRFKLPRA